MKSVKRIASVGDNCVDVYINKGGEVYVGGNAVNLAVAVRRLGVGSSYIGMVGDDNNGRLIARVLAEECVDVSHLHIMPGETAWTKIKLENNDRIPIDEDIGVQRRFALTDDDYGFIKEHDFIHYTAFTNWPSAYGGGIPDYKITIKTQLERFVSDKVRLSMDFSDQEIPGLLELSRNKVEVAFFSRSEMNNDEIREEASRLINYGFRVVVLTRGIKGSCAFDGVSYIFQGITPVELVDPLGAGDAFMGAFLSGYVSEKSIKECLQIAADYSAQVCGRFGGL